MKFVFIVQGEGKGHSTQAEALGQILTKNGHKAAGIFTGRPFKFNIFFKVLRSNDSYFSPFFISKSDKKGIDPGLTFLVNILLSPLYIIEVFRLAVKIRRARPDVVVNFYDIIGGIAFLFLGGRKFVISHHFFFDHPAFVYPPGRKTERALLKIHSRITSAFADKILALSFTEEENTPSGRLFIIPPLIRQQVMNAQVSPGGHIHVYTLMPGYLPDVERWCRMNPRARVNMFSRFTFPIPKTSCNNLSIFPLGSHEFLDSLAGCSGVICTSGFETLVEAAILNKPLEVFPAENHYEQLCNSYDLERSGYGTRKNSFSPSLPGVRVQGDREVLRTWVSRSEEIITGLLCG